MTTYKIAIVNGKKIQTIKADDNAAIVITMQPIKKEAEITAQELVETCQK